jgi:ribonuclease HII
MIRGYALAWSIGVADVAEIDSLNILQATLLAMRRAVIALPVWPASVAVDGNRLPDLRFHARSVEGEAVIGGDGKVASISAASIIAKVYRDRVMAREDRRFPGFGFASNKGYGTADHLDALQRLGPCDIHRRSFRPVRKGQARRRGETVGRQG